MEVCGENVARAAVGRARTDRSCANTTNGEIGRRGMEEIPLQLEFVGFGAQRAVFSESLTHNAEGGILCDCLLAYRSIAVISKGAQAGTQGVEV